MFRSGRTLLCLTTLLRLTTLLAPVGVRAQEFPSNEQLTARIRALVEQGGPEGIVLGALGADGSRRVVWFGSGGPGTRPLGPRSLFEIGSINKTFTGILLAQMAARGEVALTDPVAQYLPAGVQVPSRASREITLLDLATHRSGLPRVIERTPADPHNPFADYTVAVLYDFLARYQLPRDIGSKFEYSNLGFGLLGHALGRAAGSSYEEVVRTRILQPLGLSSTTFRPTGELAGWVTKGHDQGAVVAAWDATDAIAGAGGLRSNAEDLLTYLAANVAFVDTPLGRAIRDSHVRQQDEDGGDGIGLAWSIRRIGDLTIIGHAGGTGGFRSFIGFDPTRRVGLVLLANGTAREGRLIQLGYDLLAPKVP